MTTHQMHVALNVADLARSVAFYEAFFGTPAAKVHGDHAKFEIEDPPLVFSLNPSTGETAPRALSHLGIRVADAATLSDARRRLETAGVELRDEPNTTCCYAVQDKVWATDPDGNSWEFYVLLADADVHSAADTACCATDTACCPSPAADPAVDPAGTLE